MSNWKRLKAEVCAKPPLIRSLHEWTSPTRRFGHRELQMIPVELYLEIIEYLKPSTNPFASQAVTEMRLNDLRSLSLVCRFFCALTLPIIFKSIVLRLNMDSGGYIPFCRSLNQGEAFAESLALHVKQCAFRDWLDTISLNKGLVKAFFDIYVNAVPKMTHITSFILSRTRITAELLANIRRLPNLTTFTLECCDLDDLTEKNIQKFASTVKLDTFRVILQEDSRNLPPDSASRSAQLLPMDRTRLVELRSDCWALTEALITSSVIPPPPPLRILQVFEVDDLKLLCDLLYRIPTLTSLTMDSVTLPPHPVGAQPPSSISLDLSRLKELRFLTFPPHLICYINGQHRLLRLSMSTRVEISVQRRITLYSSLSLPPTWSDVTKYQYLEELCLPFKLAEMVTSLRTSSDSQTAVPKELKKLTIIDCLNSFPGPSALLENVLERLFMFWKTSSLRELRLTELIYQKVDMLNVEESENISDTYMRRIIKLLMEKKYFSGLKLLSFCSLGGKDTVWRNQCSSGKWVKVTDESEMY